MKNSARCLFFASSPLSPSSTFFSSIEAEKKSCLSYSLIARSSVLDGGVETPGSSVSLTAALPLPADPPPPADATLAPMTKATANVR